MTIYKQMQHKFKLKIKHHYEILIFVFLLIFCYSLFTSTSISQEHYKPRLFKFSNDSDYVFLKAEMQPIPSKQAENMIYWCRNGIYNNRQFTAKGVSAKALIELAFKIGPGRLIDNASLPSNPYSVEIIVPKKNQNLLISLLRQTVLSGFAITIKKEMRTVDVGVLKLSKDRPVNLQKSEGNRVAWTPGPSHVKGTGLTLGMLSKILSATSMNKPIFNGTNIKGRFDFDFKWKDINTLNNALSKLGLELVWEKRKIKMFIVERVGDIEN